MPKRRKYSLLDIALVALVLLAGVIVFSTLRTNTNLEQEQAELESRVKLGELNLSEIEKLEQAQSAQGNDSFPSETEAVEFTNQVAQYAVKTKATIVTWSSVSTSTTLRDREYPAIKHSLQAEGSLSALISFVETLTRAPVTPAVQHMDINLVNEKDDIWRLALELVVYYR